MKILLYFFSLLLLTVAGCASDESTVFPEANSTPASAASLAGKWQLIHFAHTSMVAGKPGKPETPPYQETIEFRADSTFRRYRSNGYEATGTYTFVQYGAGDSGILATFDNPDLSYHELPGQPDKIRSYAEGKVYLRQTGPGVLVESYAASDGPSFHYRQSVTQE
jgi:hypothetical protein